MAWSVLLYQEPKLLIFDYSDRLIYRKFMKKWMKMIHLPVTWGHHRYHYDSVYDDDDDKYDDEDDNDDDDDGNDDDDEDDTYSSDQGSWQVKPNLHRAD